MSQEDVAAHLQPAVRRVSAAGLACQFTAAQACPTLVGSHQAFECLHSACLIETVERGAELELTDGVDLGSSLIETVAREEQS